MFQNFSRDPTFAVLAKNRKIAKVSSFKVISTKFSERIFLRMTPDRYIAGVMVDLWLKLQMEIVDYNNSIFTCLPSLHIFCLNFKSVMYQSAEAHPRPSQIFKINLLRE